jgi:S-adenosylmethionine synthetase
MTEIEPVVRAAVKDIGYEQDAFHYANFEFQNYLHEQSSDIAMGVDSGDNKDEGAGDQGLMFGYACDETDVLMPAAIHYSHQILKDLATVRKQDADSILGPDSKSQISLVYDDNGRPTGVHKVVLSTQHSEKATQADILALVTPVIANVLPDGWMVTGDDLLVNPTGQFVIGGPDGDTGLTGRKIIVDTYGGAAPHGGGAFSGKDPTKVDRSAAYASRYLAKNVVAAGLASRCTIQIAYAIGVAEPVSLYANTHGTGTIDDKKLQQALRDCMDLSPRGIRQHLGMNAPIYAPTAAYGHFGRIAGEAGAGTFSWEATDLVDALRAAAR